MIPKILHYCWFGPDAMPPLAEECIASWHRQMPHWEYRMWNEKNFDIGSNSYTREAYEAGEYAFVSDYVRLWALERYGGLYLDVDFEVYKPFDDLLHHTAFAGIEGSKRHPVMMGVCGSEAHGIWVSEMLEAYTGRHFLLPDGSCDLTTNVQFLSARMQSNGLRLDGSEQEYRDLHLFPVDYFSPRQTTGEYLRTNNTYCESRNLHSWSDTHSSWKERLLCLVGSRNRTRLIQLKRQLLG